MNATEKKLADLMRQHPNLYDPSRRDYKETIRGHASWREIADAMGKSEEEVKLKWKNLRDKFVKAKKRLAKRNSPLPDDDENPLERPVPVLFNQLAWLSDYVKPRLDRIAETEISSADALTNLRDEDELFLLSLLPSMKRLTIKKRMEVRMKFQQVLYAAEFED
uniref:Uncharacterized LOC110950772 n=1 Tax=Acanthochromis polyacanthus TaxID=80966 RepID=A0A3Q1I0S6_9TELE